MYVQVRLLKGYSELLWYKIPDEWPNTNLIGQIIKVPMRNHLIPAFIEHVQAEKPEVSFEIRVAEKREPFPLDAHYIRFLVTLGAYYQIEPLMMLRRIRKFLVQKEETISEESYAHESQSSITLTMEQQHIADFINTRIDAPVFVPIVVHGVTGSGKTEIYKYAIQHSVSINKSVLLLLPEVSLAVSFTNLLKKAFGNQILIFGFHSATSAREKKQLWHALCTNKPCLIIGVHLPVLLPLSNLGLIIIDEEHESGFQEKRYPKINSKEAALIRAQEYDIPIVLGSATPSITTLHNIKTKQWHFFQLKNRFAGAFPTIKIVDLITQKKRKYFWVTQELETALKECLAKREQALIFLNRRGFCFFVQCKYCSFIFMCAQCSVSLTLHQSNVLKCHYCDYTETLAQKCPTCSADGTDFLKKGIGTQQLVSLLKSLLPEACIARADLDATINRKKWQQTMQDFQAGAIDILVGTQTITKGYHFPRVTLVGILWADLNLNIPFYNASEIALQQLIQVAGRAGRQHAGAQVIVQTMMKHPIFNYIEEIEYQKFYDYEVEVRKRVNYPPFCRFAEFELRHENEKIVEQEAQMLIMLLKNQKKINATLLGPALPPVHKIKNIHMRKIYVKAQRMQDIITLYKTIDKNILQSNLLFTPSPMN